MNYTIPLAVSGVGVYFGYFYIKKYFKNYITNYVMDEVNKVLADKQNDEEVLFKPLERTNSALIHYKHGGKEHTVCVPYNRSKSRPMLRQNVYLVIGDDREENNEENTIEITHKPGVPYLLSPKQMGGSKIIVKKDNKIIKEYSEDEVPNYLEN